MSNKPTYEELELRVKELELDAVKQKQIKEEQQESEKRYETLINTSTEGIQLTDLDGRVTFSNPAHHKIHGYLENELIGKFVWEMAAEESERTRTKEYYNMLIKDQPQPEPFYSVDKTTDGRLIHTQVNWEYVRDSEGKLTGIISIISDITGRIQAEKALKESEKKLHNAHKELELKVKKRTTELDKINSALTIVLRKSRDEKIELEEKVLSNVKGLIFPFINALKNSPLNNEQISFLNTIESNITNIISPFSRTLSSKYSNLTPREIQIASLIRDGKTSKEIAELIASNKNAVEFHRTNLRKKLGLRYEKKNLRSHLLSLQQY
jgi:PAS domain S-box-containing protein